MQEKKLNKVLKTPIQGMKEFKVEFSNKPYKLQFHQSPTQTKFVLINNYVYEDYWECEFSFDELQQQQNKLYYFDSEEEFLESMLETLKNDQFKLIPEDRKTMKNVRLEITYSIPIECNKKQKCIYYFFDLGLKQQEKIPEWANSLCNKVNSIQSQIESMDGNKNIIEDNQNGADFNDILSYLGISKESMKKHIEMKNQIAQNSTVLKEQEETNSLFQLLDSEIKNFKNKKISFLYRSSGNVHNNQQFHNICDGKGPFLTLLKTQNQGVVGHYAPCQYAFNQNGSYNGVKYQSLQERSFTFSLNDKKVNHIMDNQQAYCGNISYGPFSYYLDIFQGQKFNFSNNNNYYYSNSTININNQTYVDYEVYQIK